MIHGVVRTSSSVCQVILRWSRTRGGGHVSTSPLQGTVCLRYKWFLCIQALFWRFSMLSQCPEQVRRLAVLDIADCKLTVMFTCRVCFEPD